MIDIKKAFESIWLDGLIVKLKSMQFSNEILEILIEMLYNRTFSVTTGRKQSANKFRIINGLQQGSITAPILFNLYTADLIKNEILNSKNVQSCAYADDMIVYSSNYLIGNIQKNLQLALNYIQNYLNLWHIEINTSKCESILFRRPLLHANRDLKRNWRKLSIKIDNQPIELKEKIKYLGVNIDNMCYLAEHTKKQLEKARCSFMGAKRIFFSKHLDKKVKIIAYKALIRPILTYGCQVWYNQAPRYMERYRVFERKCLRHCNGLFRKANTDFRHYISNKDQYANYDGDRIDNHILKLTRDHIRRATLNKDNSLIYGPYHVDELLAAHYAKKGMNPGPNMFIYFDKLGFLQDDNKIPIIYHIQRRPNERWLDEEKFKNPSEHIRYNTIAKEDDPDEYEARCERYWWLNTNH